MEILKSSMEMANKKESVSKKKLDNNLLSIDLGYSGVKYYYKYQDKEYFWKVLNAVKETKKAADGLLYENKKLCDENKTLKEDNFKLNLTNENVQKELEKYESEIKKLAEQNKAFLNLLILVRYRFRDIHTYRL